MAILSRAGEQIQVEVANKVAELTRAGIIDRKHANVFVPHVRLRNLHKL